MVVIYLSTRYLVRYRYGQAPGYAVPGSTHFAPREAPARLAFRNPTWGMSTMNPAAPYACRGGYILAKNNLRGAQPCPCECHTPRREWRICVQRTCIHHINIIISKHSGIIQAYSSIIQAYSSIVQAYSSIIQAAQYKHRAA